ncbi:COG3650 family protein [Novosphingobium fluoreni]|uniref:COG3650 family protein n=1 Tax=Novosphingobium fluoreni TaxID=1391222 RepID=UPI003DA0DE34
MTLHRVALVSALGLALIAVSGCGPRRGEDNGGVPGDTDSSKPFSAISPRETLHFGGTEPFWNGTVIGETLTYATPAQPDGTRITVKRFGGRNGLGLSGTLEGKSFDMTVTPGTCSDGMSDGSFPFSVLLKLGEETRQGCGWTDSRRFTEAKDLAGKPQ